LCFYILLSLSYLNCTCTFDTCLLNINQSVDQYIIRYIDVHSKADAQNPRITQT